MSNSEAIDKRVRALVHSSPAPTILHQICVSPLQQELKELDEFPSTKRKSDFKSQERQEEVRGKQFKECYDNISGEVTY